MQIVIDTSKDSHEEIKKVIRMLSELVGETVYTNSPAVDAPSPESEETTSAFNSMFGDIGGGAAPVPEPGAAPVAEEVEEEEKKPAENLEIMEY